MESTTEKRHWNRLEKLAASAGVECYGQTKFKVITLTTTKNLQRDVCFDWWPGNVAIQDCDKSIARDPKLHWTWPQATTSLLLRHRLSVHVLPPVCVYKVLYPSPTGWVWCIKNPPPPPTEILSHFFYFSEKETRASTAVWLSNAMVGAGWVVGRMRLIFTSAGAAAAAAPEYIFCDVYIYIHPGLSNIDLRVLVCMLPSVLFCFGVRETAPPLSCLDFNAVHPHVLFSSSYFLNVIKWESRDRVSCSRYWLRHPYILSRGIISHVGLYLCYSINLSGWFNSISLFFLAWDIWDDVNYSGIICAVCVYSWLVSRSLVQKKRI